MKMTDIQQAPKVAEQTTPNTPQTPNATPNAEPNSIGESLIKGLDDDLATNGSWIDGITPPPSGGGGLPVTSEQAKAMRASDNDGLVRGDGFVTDPKSAKVEQNIGANFELAPNVRDLAKINTDEISADLSYLADKHPEMFEKASDVFKLIKEIKDEPQFFYRNNRLDGALIAKRLQEQGKIGKVVVDKESGEVIHATKSRESDLARLERVANKNDERVRALSAVSSRKAEQGGGLPNENIAQRPLKTADDEDIIDLVPDEKGVYSVVFNGPSQELSKMGVEIAKGEIKSAGAKKILAIADKRASEVASQVSAKIADDISMLKSNSIEFYAQNTQILNEIAKKYPTLNQNEVKELANKQIIEAASPELIAYTKAINGGDLPSDARLLGTNASRLVAKSLEMGADPKALRDYLLLSGIKADYATALAKQLKSRDINAFNESISAAETRLTNEAVENARATARNESIGQILEGAKAKALENDKALKNGIGNQSLDDVVTTFKSQNSGKEFEISENGFGRELVSYNGKKADDETKRAFMSWEAQGDKADTTLKDGRKVVHLGADEAMELSYGNGYLYGEKNYEALMKRKQSESLEGRFARLQSHPAYENLLKYRENTLANELKGERMLVGDRAAVYYEPQSQRYLRTKPDTAINPERSISLTKTDVKNLRDGKIDQALLTKLESNLDALTAAPQASALLDHLLTRDFHLGTAEYKKGLIAQPKKSAWQENFEKIHGIKKDEPNSRILTNKDIKEQISKWDFNSKKKIIVEQISDTEAKKLNSEFNFKGKKPLARQIDSEHLKHIINRHLGSDENSANIPFDSVDEIIDGYTNTTKNYDLRELIGDNRVIYAKQINGHYIAIEEAFTGQDKMSLVSAWQTRGKINKEVLLKHARATSNAEPKTPHEVATDKQHLSQNLAEDTHNNTLANSSNYTPKEIKSQGEIKWGEKLKAKMAKMGQEYSDEKIANLANWHKNSHAVTKEKDGSPKVFYHGTNAKFDAFDIDKGKGSWLGKSFYFTDSKSKAKGYGKNVMPLYLNIKNPYIAKANDHYGFVNEVKEKFGVKENYGEFDPAQVLKENGYDGVVYKDWDSDVGTIYTAFSPNQIKSIDNNGAFNPRSKMMRGFSTQIMIEAMTNLGSGGVVGSINAANEQDPSKKAEAFVKGFLLGFGGSAGAGKLLSKAPRLAPQLAKASEKMASELPRIFNDRPDILGGVLGRMNNAKDNFKNIFGGEKALGANKAKLEEAQTMLKSGKNEGEIWAKTGWYKDIDGKWKFEINPKGGELKEAKSDLFSQDDIKKWQKEYIEKKLSLNELSELNDKYKGQIDITPIARAYNESENISIKELSEKYPNLKMSVADYMDMGVYKEFYTQNKIITARKVANGEVDFDNKLLKEVLDDKELFKAYAELEDLPILTTNIKKDGVKAYFMRTNSKGIEDDAIFFDYEYLQTASKDDIRSTLYHELQHAVQKIEGFASGADSKAAGLENYFKSAGEAEARNEQIRLGSSEKEREYIVNNPQRKELIAQIKEVTAKNSNLDQIMSDYKAGKITAEQRNELIKQNSENIQKATAQLVAKREMLDKKLAEEYLAKTHPYETMDVAPNERIVSFNDSVNAKSSLSAQSKELLKQKIKASDGDFSGANDARARLVLDQHRTKAEQIRKEKGANSPEYQEAKNFADEFEATHFESDGTPKLVPSPCRL